MKKPTIRFWLRTDRKNLDSTCPVHLIYQISGQRKYFSTSLKLFPCNWDETKQQAVYINQRTARQLMPDKNFSLDFPTVKDIEDTNADLAGYRKRINGIEKSFAEKNILFSVSMVIGKLKESERPLTKKDVHTDHLFDFMEKYIADNQFTREPGSLTVYRTAKKHLTDFQQHTKMKITFEKIDYNFFQSFQNYLISEKKLNNTTVAKILSTVKTFLNYARKHGIEVSDRYKDFRIKKETLDVIALTDEEFQTLYNLDLSGNNRLEQVRDVFCFSCATGLRYSDLAQLRREHIKGDEIKITVKKTKQTLTIPLNQYSQTILDKYKKMYRPIPVISNQRMNDYVKDLAKIAGMDTPVEVVRFQGAKRIAEVFPKHELITVHTGRKTFATLSLERGMSAEEVMTITGHRDYKSFKRYVKITEQRKKLVMDKAWGK